MTATKVTVLTGILVLLGGLAYAQVNSTSASLSWSHDGKYASGFRLYKGPSSTALVKAVDIPGAEVRSFSYSTNDTLPVCFGLSAYGPGGESSITTKDESGQDVCISKSARPDKVLISGSLSCLSQEKALLDRIAVLLKVCGKKCNGR